MERIPRIQSVSVIGPSCLAVRFENRIEKRYDCTPLLAQPRFRLLQNPVFFRAVKVDAGGYGVSWNDDIDLSEYELWMNGQGEMG